MDESTRSSMRETELVDGKVRSASIASMANDTSVLDDVLLHIRQGIGMRSEAQEDFPRDFLEITLFCRALGSVWRAREDALCGYPSQCYILLRSAFEDFLTFTYVQHHPEQAILWVHDSFPTVEVTGQRPSLAQIRTAIGDTGEFKEYYGVLSEYTHPRHRSLQSLWEPSVKESGEEKHRFWFLGRWNPDSLSESLQAVRTMAAMLLLSVDLHLLRVLGKGASEWRMRAKVLRQDMDSIDRRKKFRIVESGEALTPTHDDEEADG